MKICLVGDFSSNRDEGLKNIAHYIADNLSKHRDVQLLKINVKNILSLSTLGVIKKFHPAIIHYVPGPTNKSFILLKIIGIYLKYKPKVVMSAPYPTFNSLIFKLLNFKPDFMLAHSKELKERLELLDIKTQLLPNGVNVEKFKPITNFEKIKLREKYGIEKDKFTVLHVGHIMKKRNLKIIAELAKYKDIQIIIVASNYIKTDYKLLKDLQENGCLIFQGYFPEIEEFYQLSDCYLFPVKKGDSIFCPLSVMEAMSCNLPVVSTDFEGLKTFFDEGNGLIFAKREEELVVRIESIKKWNISIATREKVEPYSWQNITREIEHIYKSLIADDDT